MVTAVRRVESAITIASVVLTLTAGASPATRAAAQGADVQLTPLLAAVLAIPRAVPLSDGRRLLPYEIEVTNATDAPLTIESVEVRDPQRGNAIVATLSSSDVAANLLLPGAKNTATLGPGQAGVLLVNLPLADGAVPKALEHSIAVSMTRPKESTPTRLAEKVARTDVDPTPPIVLGPPLRGERWVAEASCCDSYHRRAILPLNGRRFLAQRFAIDWAQLDEQNRLATGDPSRNESYPQFGKDVLAVADGVVTHIVDGLPAQRPGALPPDATVTTADGNSVILDLGDNRYALYAHLQAGSLRVRPGERVRRGQVLGLLGNSGNSELPHLHFHVMDGPSALASNGVPYVIDAFDVTGQAVSADDLETEIRRPDQSIQVRSVPRPAQRARALPADLAVVSFGK